MIDGEIIRVFEQIEICEDLSELSFESLQLFLAEFLW